VEGRGLSSSTRMKTTAKYWAMWSSCHTQSILITDERVPDRFALQLRSAL